MPTEVEKLKRLNKQITKQRIRFCQENERLRMALRQIADEKEIHTKLSQERLCCKFQNIAMLALQELKKF